MPIEPLSNKRRSNAAPRQKDEWNHGTKETGCVKHRNWREFDGGCHAQERNLPALNSFGRFFGIGWSRGYHAGAYDGRFQHEKASHPASMYGSNALLYPYQPGYEPPRPFMQASPALAQPVYSNTVEMQGFGSILQGPSNQPMPNASTQLMPSQVPAIPAKPIEPPPTWLRPFLKEEANQPWSSPSLPLVKMYQLKRQAPATCSSFNRIQRT